MSGRLIITGKKSFCPWAPKNVERVLRDERLERERIEREDVAHRKREAEHRVKTWKQNRNNTSQIEQPKHINLFETEELNCLASRDDHNVEKKVGIMPLFLGGNKAERNKAMQDFYWRKADVDREKDEQIKDKMDPMRLFRPVDKELGLTNIIDGDNAVGQDLKRSASHSSSPDDNKRDHKKKRRKDSDNKKHLQMEKISIKSRRKSLEEMKRRLVERDRIEKERERDICAQRS
jgi:hypothetical protein